jgi:transcriptional regulator with GAF, ATPase, and Fis domain
MKDNIDAWIQRIEGFGKENLEEILHLLSGGIQQLSGSGHCRIYLEDLTEGALCCMAAVGGDVEQLRKSTFAINNDNFLVSRVYQQQQEASIDNLADSPADLPVVGSQGGGSYFLPLIHRGRSIGVVCLDRSRAGGLPREEVLPELRRLLAAVAAILDRARVYHQQVILSRRVDEAKKREAALFMVHSAARLVERVALASVLVPTASEIDGERTLQILASYSKEPEAKRLYEQERRINLSPGGSLLSRFIDRAGVISDDSLLVPLYIPDLADESLQKQYLTEELGLRSLYVVPRFDSRTRRVICLVHYYTKEKYQFTPFERGLLEAHAEMAQQVVQQIGDEHLEVQVLSEISDLLQQSADGLQAFLHRVLSKATRLIGADTGSIALVRELDGERWLMVENAEGALVGAKSKDWMKKYIPPIRIGAEELPPGQRSLTGLAAATGQPALVNDTREELRRGGFYAEVTEAVRSELAVPVIYAGEVLAVICVDSLRPNYFSSEHRRILLIIERMISRHLASLQRIEQLTGEIDRLSKDVDYRDPSVSSYRLGNIIGNSLKAQQVVETIQRVTPPLCQRLAYWKNQSGPERADILGLPSVLITGRTGAGKEFLFNNLYARLNDLYRERFPGSSLPLKKSNIAAYSGELTYSELFGHKRGAFTGAHVDRRGILEEADGGVVFLDEIGDADPKTQVQLLRFLDSGEFVRLGENITRHAHVLLVAGTNRDLRQLIAGGTFREDLYHRLSELIITVPSLNERREDIPDLAVHFLGRLAQVYRPEETAAGYAPVLAPAAKAALSQHQYSGNMRELRSILLRAMLYGGQRIGVADIERAIAQQSEGAGVAAGPDLGELKRQAAEVIVTRILAGDGDFWSEIYQPFSRKELTRDGVIEVIEQLRRRGAVSMPKLALVLAACDPEAEPRQFYRFKNFLYKTVKI